MPSVADRFARVAGGYDRLNRILSLGLDVRWRKRALAELARRLPADGRRELQVLDLATGTADFAIAAARRFPLAHIEGLDLTPEMLAAGERKVRNARLSARITLKQGDASSLPYGDRSFDVALCAFGFRNFSDRKLSLAELARILKDRGFLVVLEFFRPQSALLGAFTATWLRCVSAVFAADVADDYAYLRTSIGGMCPAEEFAAEAQAAGLAVERSKLFLPACRCLVLRKFGKL